MIAPFSERSPSGTHRAKHFVWITSFILVRTMRACILIPTLQGNCGAAWSVAFLRPLHPTDTWTMAAGRSLLLRFGSSKADLETRNQAPAGHVEVVPGRLGGRGERRKSRELWADEQGHPGWSFWGPFGQLHIRCVNCPHRSTQGQGSQTLARGSLSGRRTVLGRQPSELPVQRESTGRGLRGGSP